MSETNSMIVHRSFAGKTDAGILRANNEDSYYIDPENRFCLVADGMGGHAGGKEASSLASEKIRAYLEEHWEADIDCNSLLEKALYHANQSIVEEQVNYPEREGMGTTAVVVLFRQGNVWYGHVGDSRLYLLRDKQLQQITQDHTWIARALKLGDVSPQQAKSHPWRHILFQCLGRKELPQVEIGTVPFQSGDRLLLCSDGLTEEVPEADIKQLLESNTSNEQIAAELVETAKQNGGSDNITVIVVNYSN
jgi:serine/threonine protein phosphatase PrpC